MKAYYPSDVGHALDREHAWTLWMRTANDCWHLVARNSLGHLKTVQKMECGKKETLILKPGETPILFHRMPI